MSIHPGGDQLSSVDLGAVFLDVRHLAREELPLHDATFLVEVFWTDASGRTGTGKVVAGYSETSGLFWFFRPGNWELLVKVLNGCALNGHYWVLGAAATNVGYSVRVLENFGEPAFFWVFENPVGRASPFFVNTEAIPCG